MGLSNSSKHDELSCILTTKNLTFRHWWLDIRGFLHVVAWQRIPKWRLRGPRFMTQRAQIQDSGLWRAALVVHHFFSHLFTFCTHNNHCNPWIGGTCILQVIQSCMIKKLLDAKIFNRGRIWQLKAIRQPSWYSLFYWSEIGSCCIDQDMNYVQWF